ncbi:hypothetical protein TYRP_005622 [Tyrophagus putrescentiae]|nr:hypothetical protein TYRP_005622 [Tyrophagus putrescentiae]
MTNFPLDGSMEAASETPSSKVARRRPSRLMEADLRQVYRRGSSAEEEETWRAASSVELQESSIGEPRGTRTVSTARSGLGVVVVGIGGSDGPLINDRSSHARRGADVLAGVEELRPHNSKLIIDHLSIGRQLLSVPELAELVKLPPDHDAFFFSSCLLMVRIIRALHPQRRRWTPQIEVRAEDDHLLLVV